MKMFGHQDDELDVLQAVLDEQARRMLALLQTRLSHRLPLHEAHRSRGSARQPAYHDRRSRRFLGARLGSCNFFLSQRRREAKAQRNIQVCNL